MDDIEVGYTRWCREDESSLAESWSFEAEYRTVEEASKALLESFRDHPQAHTAVLIQDIEPAMHIVVWNPSRYSVCMQCFRRRNWLCECEEGN